MTRFDFEKYGTVFEDENFEAEEVFDLAVKRP